MGQVSVQEQLLDALAREIGPRGALLFEGDGGVRVVSRHDPERELEPGQDLLERILGAEELDR